MADGLIVGRRWLQLLSLWATLAATNQTSVAADLSMTDPTRPPPGFQHSSGSENKEDMGATTTSPAEAPLAVTSLFLLRDKPYALVNGIIVRLGDPLAGGKVSQIDAHGIWITSPGEGKNSRLLRQIKLLPNIIKTPVLAPLKKQAKTQKNKQPKTQKKTRLETPL
jgi:hypothetical protein